MISKLEGKISNIDGTLESFKEEHEHTSLVNENMYVFSTLKEKVDIMESGTYPILKLEIQKLKGQFTDSIKSPSVISSDSSGKRKNFK